MNFKITIISKIHKTWLQIVKVKQKYTFIYSCVYLANIYWAPTKCLELLCASDAMQKMSSCPLYSTGIERQINTEKIKYLMIVIARQRVTGYYDRM